jgi:hypothetical protein
VNKKHGTRTDHAQVAETKTEVEVRLGGRCSGGIKGTAVVGSVGIQLDSGAPAGDGKRLDLDSADADQDGKVSGMAAGAATVIWAMMIRANLNYARSLDRGEADQDQQDQQNPAHFIPASDLRRELAGYAHS